MGREKTAAQDHTNGTSNRHKTYESDRQIRIDETQENGNVDDGNVKDHERGRNAPVTTNQFTILEGNIKTAAEKSTSRKISRILTHSHGIVKH